MGRLLAALIAVSENAPAAIRAIPAIRPARNSGIAGIAAPTVPETTTDDQPARLLAALRSEGLPDGWLGRDHGDIAELAALNAAGLRAYVLALKDADLREHGKRPADETARALCRSCGPIWIAPEVAHVAPMVDGWPRVIGCAWCHVKNRRAIPRPPVTCGECRHFDRDTVKPAGGVGRCRADHEPLRNEPLPYPNAARECKQHKPERTMSHDVTDTGLATE